MAKFGLKKLLVTLASISGIGKPGVTHILVVVFLEYFAWGLLTMPMIATLKETFPDHTFLMNGLVMGVKGILSFLSAPLIGALSDIYGRKLLLLITVIFTCLPIPMMTIDTWWFFAISAISGILGVSFSVVFAYVADVTTKEERTRSYGFVSATFAASLVIAPALGNLIMELYGINTVVFIATLVSTTNVMFVLLAVPESLPRKVRSTGLSWKQADPFLALLGVCSDPNILLLCIVVFMFLLPEAGEYSSVPAYLKLTMGFDFVELSMLVAFMAILSISVNVTLGSIVKTIGAKRSILLGLLLELLQLILYAVGDEKWQMWLAGNVAALSSITFPAVSAYVSLYTDGESQGAVQGMITGMSGLCNGLGPAIFGIVFYLSDMDLSEDRVLIRSVNGDRTVAGPFMFGAISVFIGILLASYIPDEKTARGKKEEFSALKYIIEMDEGVAKS
ncbi:hippocampus abundant transcript-like protein 1 [Drosophila rhopaloa]|uniref:Major facilitator superfamily (MFS) profile domain-containing protein n=1 Tax=Drosophila rhopaloa TaxID=1041015 RepID=A0ABM5GVY6_DRORH|nr:hippocampus abundant transcript-like protein 1 [Drosophila rhopaloa]